MPTLAKGLLGVTGVFLLLLIVYPVFVPVKSGHGPSCLNNAKQLGIAVMIYITDYDDRFPQSDAWADNIYEYVKNPDIYRCPTGERPGGYAYNLNLDRVDARAVNVPERTPMLFDTFTFTPNPAGGPERVDYRHKGGASFVRTDSSARYYPKDKVGELIWEVPLGPHQPTPAAANPPPPSENPHYILVKP